MFDFGIDRPLSIIAENYPYTSKFYLSDDDKVKFIDELAFIAKAKKTLGNKKNKINYIEDVAQSLIDDFDIITASEYVYTLEKILELDRDESHKFLNNHVIKHIRSYL